MSSRIIVTPADGPIVRLTVSKLVTPHTHAATDIVSGALSTARLGSGTADNTTFLRGDQTWAPVTATAFGTIAVSGQDNIVADVAMDTLTIAAGSNITLTTDASTDTLTIAASGGGGGSGSTNLSIANKTAATLDIASDTGTDATLPAATADDAGLMTAAQYTKLAGVEASASAAGATGDAFATSHLSAFAHANIANGQTAYGWGNHASAGYLTSVAYGTTAGTACEGNDSRLSDARTPTSHSHSAADLTSGTVATARLGSGTADNTTYLRGDQTWATVPAGVTVEDTPVDGHTAAAVSSNWAYDHATASDPHPGYALESAIGTAASHAATDFEPAQTAASQAEAEAGTETAIRSWSPLRIWQGIAAKVAAMLAAGIAPYLTGYTEKLYVATTSGNVTIDLANGTFHRYTLDAARQFTMPAGPGAYASSFSLLILCQTYTPTWNSTPTITWMTDDGTAPTLNTATGKLNRLYFEWDNTTSAWLGYLLRAQA